MRWAPKERAGTVLVYAALTVATLSICALLLAVSSLTSAERALLLAVAMVAWVALVALASARGTLQLVPVLAAIVLTLVCAVTTPSHQSKDIFSYATYGRIITEYHDNPYSAYPMQYPGDPMSREVSRNWQRTPDIYGAGFTAIMAAASPVIGESTVRARVVYQLVAALAAGAVLWLLWRRGRSPVALAFMGLHPLLAVSVVNGGHPDALIALGLLGGVLLAMERRPVAAGLACALAISINLTFVAPAIVLAVWAARRWPRVEVVKFGAVAAGLGVVPYFFLAGWLATAREHSRLISRQSIWNVVGGLVTKTGPISFASLDLDQLRTLAATGASMLTGILLVVLVVRHTSSRAPEFAVAAAVVVVMVGSAWVMPWYAFATLPLLATRRPTLLTWTVALYSAAILIGDQYPSLSAGSIGSVLQQLLQTWAPVVALVACVAVIATRPRESSGGEAATPPTAEPALAASA